MESTAENPPIVGVPLLNHGPFTLTTLGVIVNGVPDFTEWEAALTFARHAERASPFWIGDLLNYGESRFGEKYAAAVEATGLTYGTLANAAYVARQVPTEVRREGVPFSQHQEIAPLPPDKQTFWLDAVEEDGLSVAELRARLKQAHADAHPDDPPPVFWLTIGCESASEQHALAEQFRLQGRAVKLG